ncbi:hypothetical protein [Enterococcus sp. AZ196]|uniref:hypothetical protein n=1 Tax=Enterococcus sp. AZ196 TaxID=2774659 RepID=UPI003D29CE19
MKNKLIKKIYHGYYLELTVGEATKELKDFLLFTKSFEIEPYPEKELEPYIRISTIIFLTLFVSLFIVPFLMIQTSNLLVALTFPSLILLHRINSNIRTRIFEKKSSQEFLDWRKQGRSKDTLQYMIIKKGKDFGSYRSISLSVGKIKTLFYELTGYGKPSNWDVKDEGSKDSSLLASDDLSYEEEWIFGAKVFLEMLEELPEEIINENALLQIPIKTKIKPVLTNKISIDSSHLLIKTNHSLYGIKVLGRDFQAAEIR